MKTDEVVKLGPPCMKSNMKTWLMQSC